MKLKQLTASLTLALASSIATKADLVPVTQDIAAGTTVTWYATNTYRLDTVIYVQSNAVLNIEPGTVIFGATNVTTARTGIPNLVSALWVTRGAKLMAQGTPSQPIIFTAEGDDLQGNLPPTQTALWGGIVLMGNAVINSAKDATGNAANPKFDVYEGTTDPGPNLEHVFGGTNDTDNSGVLRYVSIRHAGNEFAPASELNGLTAGAVGSGTTLEYIEVFAGSDDGFEWWGGTVNAHHLISAFCEDDDFDTDQGFRGTLQFVFGIKPPWAGTSDSRGFESDGDLNQSATGELPIGQWTAYNATLIGRGKSETSGSLGVGWNLRDESAPNVFNSVLSDFNQGLLLDGDGLFHLTNSPALAFVENNIWDVTTNANTAGEFLFSTAAFSNSVQSALLGGVSYTNDALLDPRPQAGSPVYANVRSGAPVAVNYRGAFSGPTDTWADSWTALASLGYLKPAQPSGNTVIPVTQDIAAGTTVTWYATNTYRLDTVIYVQSNAVLNIEPGTVIFGATNVTTARTGIPNLVSALWVTRGAKLMAQGTPSQPIIFTAEGDDLQGNLPPTQTALWGGIVLMGNAVINSAKDATGNAANPKFDVYEGTTDPGPNLEHVFGGTNDTDNSGVLRYVSIRHAGNEFAPASELNGLTAGAVGSGTTLEYIEVFAGSDDGFEWWGGTVNAHHLISAFCEDDDFDTDQGFRGTLQFVFGIKPPWAGTSDSRGFESDGDLNQSATGELPIGQWTAYNATLIGRGKSETSGSLGVGWNLRDESAPNVFNSVLSDFNQGLLLDGDGLFHLTNSPALAFVENNIWDVTTNANTAGEFLFSTAAFSNSVQSALLGGVSYTNDALLDPRPQAGSPVYANVRSGAPVAVNYRGAFSGPTDTWADSWTALASLGYLKPAQPSGNTVIPVTQDIAAGTTVTWYATNTYRLDTVIYVQSNAVLNIEPGTVIFGATNVTTARTGIPNLVSALWVTRGAKLMAQGTPSQPIIFTAEGDDLHGNLPPTQTALWGGIVLMGNAVINSAKDATGNAANPKFDVYEGTTDPGPNLEHVFGGTNDTDNSGVLRYVSIRHAGNEFAPASELNGLTAGAVGSGTTLEYIEVFAGSDDGFEWWGGTVNAHHLISAFCEDDDFDTDQGFRGTLQFVFGIKPPWAGTSDSRGFESDGDLNQSATGELPIGQWTAYNATLIGRGKSETSGSLGVGWNLRDESAPNVFNSVLSDFNQGLLLDGDGLFHLTNSPALAFVENNIWDVTTNANTAGEFLFSTAAFSNSVQSALLGGVSYTNDALLDPRPQAGSPVYANVRSGAPVAVNYRGAFSGPTDTWADSWTALASLGYLKPASTIAAPSITTQPTPAVTVLPRTTVTLTVVATGEGTLAYQWFKDNAPISTATAASLTLTNVQPTDAGTYKVTINNAGGTTTSDNSVLTVNFQSYEDWAIAKAIPAAQAGLDQDPDGDGILNIAEYAFGGNPTGDSSGRLPAATQVQEGGVTYAAVTYTRNKTAVGGRILVEAASDILFQTALPLQVSSITDLGDGTERVTERTVDPLGAAGAAYFSTTIAVP